MLVKIESILLLLLVVWKCFPLGCLLDAPSAVILWKETDEEFCTPMHFTHWIKHKIEAFLKDWVVLKMSEYLGLKTYEIIYFF